MFLIFTKKRSVIKKLKKLLSLSMTIKNFNRYSNPFICRILFNYFWLIKVQDNKHVKWCLMRDQITFSNYKLLKCTSEERKCDWFFALVYIHRLLPYLVCYPCALFIALVINHYIGRIYCLNWCLLLLHGN